MVFTVARARCAELFDPPNAVTLWKLPAAVEDEFEDRWHQWLAEPESFEALFEQLRATEGHDLLSELVAAGLASADDAETVQSLRRSAEGRAVQLPTSPIDDGLLTLLAAGFSKGELGAPAIPYVALPS